MPKILSAKDFRSMPWKNGGGVTRELYRAPHSQDAERFLLRLSMAQVASHGPFSLFPGIDRTLLLLKGRGLKLFFADEIEIVLDQPLSPIYFAGEDSIECELLDGPIEDFNIMVDRQWGKTTVQLSQASSFSTKGLSFVFEPLSEQLVVLEKDEVWTREESTTVIVVDVEVLA